MTDQTPPNAGTAPKATDGSQPKPKRPYKKRPKAPIQSTLALLNQAVAEQQKQQAQIDKLRKSRITEIDKELAAAQSSVKRLTDERAALTGNAPVVPSKPKARKGAKADAGAGRGRPKGTTKSGGLRDAIVGVLQNKSEGMSVKDIKDAVEASGFETKAKDFYPVVAQALRDKETFTKLNRGVYTVKA